MIIDKIKNCTSFTPQEKELANYIISHQEDILNLTSQQLAKKAYISSSTVIRFCKKLDYQGYRDFQLQLSKDITKSKEYHDFNISREDNISDIITKTDHLYQYIVGENTSLIDKEVLNRIINYLAKAKRIDLYATDMNYHKALSMSIKLISLGYQTQVFNSINQFYLNTINSKDVISIVISLSGKNEQILSIAKELKSRHIKVIGLSGYTNPDLSLLCDETLFMYSIKNPIHSFRFGLSLDFLFDIIYFCLINKKSI